MWKAPGYDGCFFINRSVAIDEVQEVLPVALTAGLELSASLLSIDYYRRQHLPEWRRVMENRGLEHVSENLKTALELIESSWLQQEDYRRRVAAGELVDYEKLVYTLGDRKLLRCDAGSVVWAAKIFPAKVRIVNRRVLGITAWHYFLEFLEEANRPLSEEAIKELAADGIDSNDFEIKDPPLILIDGFSSEEEKTWGLLAEIGMKVYRAEDWMGDWILAKVREILGSRSWKAGKSVGWSKPIII